MLRDFLTNDCTEFIARCRSMITPHQPATEDQLLHGVSLFLDQLVHTLRSVQPEYAFGSDAYGTLANIREVRRLFTLMQVGDSGGNRAMVGSFRGKNMELTNPRPIFLNDPRGWHWSLSWKNASGKEIHRVQSDRTFATEVEARTDFKDREAQLLSERHRVE